MKKGMRTMVEPVERRGAASLEDVVAYASEFESLLHALERIGKLKRAEVPGELMRLRATAVKVR